MPTIKQLNQRHPSVNCDRLDTLRALYEGGERFEAKLSDFLPMRHLEPVARYALRKKESVYRNYIGPICDHFTALLFSSRPRTLAKDPVSGEKVLDPGDFYNRFRDDADGVGTNVDAVFKRALTEAMQTRFCWIRVSQPDTTIADGATLKEYEDSGLGDSRLQVLTAEEVLDWELDGAGRLAWAVHHTKSAKRVALSGGREDIVETWEHLLPDRVDVYQIEYESNRPPTELTDVQLVGTRGHRYGAVPLVCVDLPMGLWIASRLESPQLAHFRLSNAQTWNLTATCYSMLLAQVADPGSFEKSMGAGHGFVVKQEDKVSFIAPEAAPAVALSAEISSQKDEIYRIAQSMALGVENNAASVGRSAESKAKDAQATKVALLAYSRIVKEAIERVYDLVSAARGDEYSWAIDGLDDFAVENIWGFVDVLEKVHNMGDVPSKDFQCIKWMRIVESTFPDLSEAEKEAIKEQIKNGVEDQTVDARAARTLLQLKAVNGRVEPTPKAEADDAGEKDDTE